MTESKFSFTWGMDILNDFGFTRIFNFMFRYYSQLGLTRQEMLCLAHLASYHFDSPDGESRPSLAEIARQMGYSHRSHVSRLISSLEKKGMLTVARRPGRTSIYNGHNFAAATKKLFLEEEANRCASQSTPTRASQSTPPVLHRAHEEEKRRLQKEEKGNTHDSNDGTRTPTLESGTEISGEAQPPKRVVSSDQDAQADAINVEADVGTRSAVEHIAREWRTQMLPGLPWPEGRGKADKQARNRMEAIVRQVEAEVGRGRHEEIVECLRWMGSIVNDPLVAAPKGLDVNWLAEKRSFPAWKSHVIQHVAQRSWERKAPGTRSHQQYVQSPVEEAIEKSPEDILWEAIDLDLKCSFVKPVYDRHLADVFLRKAGDGYQLVALDEDRAWWIRNRLWRVIESIMRGHVGDAEIEVVVNE